MDGPSTVNASRRWPMRRVEETSAGGVIVDHMRPGANVALIARRDRRGHLSWALPKGHIEEGETAEDAAIREVAEETGIAGRIVASLGSIDYWFIASGRRIHKTVHHFLLAAESGELSDADIEVDAVAWVPLGELDERLTFDDERRLASKVPSLLADIA